ncbi:MAG: hypothetical protein R2939_13755 [Kofleriaceae bacterium]
MRAAWIVVLACGCGRLGFDPGGGGGNDGGGLLDDGARRDATSGLDASIDGGPCVLGPWGTPTPLPGVNTADDELGPWLSADRRELFFSSDRTGLTLDVYRATRADVAAGFDAAAAVANLNSDFGDDVDVVLSDDGLTLWYADVSGGPLLIEEMVRTVPGAPFAVADSYIELRDPGATGGASDDSSDRSPSLSADRLEILFSSERFGLDADIYRSTRGSPTGSWLLASRVDDLSASGATDVAVARSPDDQQVLLSRRIGGGAFKLYVADRQGAGFSAPTPFAPAAADGDQRDAAWSTDGRTIVYASSQAGGAGGYDLYQIERSCL